MRHTKQFRTNLSLIKNPSKNRLLDTPAQLPSFIYYVPKLYCSLRSDQVSPCHTELSALFIGWGVFFGEFSYRQNQLVSLLFRGWNRGYLAVAINSTIQTPLPSRGT